MVIASSGWAQVPLNPDPPPLPYGATKLRTRDLDIVLAINGFAGPGELVSGTWTPFGASVTAGAWQALGNETPYVGPGWPLVTVEWITLTLGDATETWAPSPYVVLAGSSAPGVTFNAEFASTHFKDDADISIKVKVGLRLECQVPYRVEHQTIESEVKPKAYNKALVLATNEWWQPAQDPPAGPTVPVDNRYAQPPFTAEYPNGNWVLGEPPGDVLALNPGNPPLVARKTIAAVIPFFNGTEGLNHTAEPATAAGAQSQTKAQIGPKFKTHTVFFCVTHGFPEGLRASQPASGASMTDPNMPWSFIKDAVQTNRTVPQKGTLPGLNLVVMVACNAVASPYAAARAFGIVNDVWVIPRRVLIGFSEVVSAKVEADTSSVEKWSAAFMERLNAGDTVEKALLFLYKNRSTLAIRDENGQMLIPSVKGDSETRLKYLYTVKENIWYRRLPDAGFPSEEVD